MHIRHRMILAQMYPLDRLKRFRVLVISVLRECQGGENLRISGRKRRSFLEVEFGCGEVPGCQGEHAEIDERAGEAIVETGGGFKLLLGPRILLIEKGQT